MKHEIKYTKTTQWLKPFVEKVKDLIPYNRITNIKGYWVRADLNEKTDGCTTIYDDNKITISLLVKSYNNPKKELRGKPIHYILDTLAHELAHTIEWEHTPKHYKIQAKIMLKFSQVIDKLKIKDTSLRFKEK